MNSEINKVLQMKQFFTLLQLKDNSAKYNLKQSSQLLIKNIHANWLQYNYAKSNKHNMPVYLNENTNKLYPVPSVFGTIKQDLQKYDKDTTLELNFCNCALSKKSELQLDLFVPQKLAMQYFIQWQRYRKYWWSSISTTPSLFSVNEFKYEDNKAHIEIVAQLPCGHQPVESISFEANENEETTRLTCSLCLEDALFILLLDGLTDSTKTEYLKLHRKIAPYKISFALKDDSNDKGTLEKLANLLHHKLQAKKVSTWLPEFILPFDLQIKENLGLGITYTAILDEDTLKFGIFHLMNSGTKLTEQVHVAEFHKYAALIFKNV